MLLQLIRCTNIFFKSYSTLKTCVPVLYSRAVKSYSASPVSHFINTSCEKTMAEETQGVTLQFLLGKLNEFAPTRLAESWDNVGLLVCPSKHKTIKKIFLTNDLTEAVLDEAIKLHSDFILSYHPPIFVPFKSLTQKTWKERIIVKCIENQIAVYSPHTSFDSVQGGVNDWMASAFDNELVTPLTSSVQPLVYTHTIELTFPKSSTESSAVQEFQEKLKQVVVENGENICDIRSVSIDNSKISIPSNMEGIPKLIKVFHDIICDSNNYIRLLKHEKVPHPTYGTGRMCLMKNPVPLAKVIELVKLHIKIPNLRVAVVPGKDLDSLVEKIAICVGSGTSVLRDVEADVYLTGEMFHHDVLDAVHKGHHVILCNHSDSERGFLIPFAQKLTKDLGGIVEVIVSKEDKDPLVTV